MIGTGNERYHTMFRLLETLFFGRYNYDEDHPGTEMKRLLSLIILLCLSVPAFAEDIVAPVFTDQDLEQYKSRDKRTLATQPPAEEEKEKEWRPARYEVPYEPMAGGVKRIIIPITINNSLTVPMALDTGATGMLISVELAEKLGVFKKDEGKLLVFARGIGRPIPAIIAVIDTVQVGKAGDDFIPTIVTDSVFKGFEGLIGMDFMSKYAIQIDTRNHVIVFEDLPPKPNMRGGHDEEWWRSTFHQFASVRSHWKELRDSLNSLKEDTIEIKGLKRLADSQNEEADKLMTKLNSYAIDNVVPMEWREY
jgi:hypothetical protein